MTKKEKTMKVVSPRQISDFKEWNNPRAGGDGGGCAFIIILTALIYLLSMTAHCQDSVTLEVLKSEVKKNKIKYELLIRETGEVVYSYCGCKHNHERGELVRIAEKDLVFVHKKRKQ